ncbi:PA2778 family cysteine peptidase [Guyparkeria hydrothermalis]|uniref:PA2778 family cysteine peptidase n=1 Tax=Guyparkeria hydrothermalis TaxID=923 RepID=UPI0020209A46|nr:PA2778 family cysteine peptidase [Guyparkeria hydrothermalis]MCL7743605.1 PA2778 family cysteine peptidase [Guyparkeria hydrothermalis]
MAALLGGCATTPPLSEETRTAVPERHVIEDVPFHGQRDYQCGPATLAMLLAEADRPAEVDELIPQVFLPGREGSVQPEMLATTRRHGLVPYVIPGTTDWLIAETAAGHPVAVLQNLSLPWWPAWHYAVVIGYDLDEESLILHSGETPRMEMGMGRFDNTWARSDRWAFVALPPGELPASPVGRPAAQAVAAFESVQGSEEALPAWRALAERRPDLALAQFGLGNALVASGESRDAVTAFRRATEADPGFAAAWLNLGLLLRSLGEGEAARGAIERAAAIPGPLKERAEELLDGS